MLNHAALEEISSTQYVDNFLDMIENLPDEVQRQVTIMRELDVRYQGLLNNMEGLRKQLQARDNQDSAWVKRLLVQLQDQLLESQELADEKLASVQQILDMIERRQHSLEINSRSIEGDSENDRPEPTPRGSGSSNNNNNNNTNNNNNSTTPTNNNNNNNNNTESYERPSKRLRRTPRMDSSLSFSSGSSAQASVASTSSAAATAATAAAAAAVSSSGGAATAQTTTAVTASQSGGSNNSSGAAAGSNAAAQHQDTANTAHDKTATQKAASTKNSSQKKASKKKKRKGRVEREREDSPTELPIDPDEPTYCLCEQVSYGEMIGCDNDLCPIEWFHFSCVGLTHKPKGKWFCPKCRGDKPTVMKPRAQFLRELEKYNKEKEEKS